MNIPLAPYISIKYVLILLFLLCVWVYRWLFAPPESRRLLLFATGFSCVIVAAVLSIEGSTWVYFTVLGAWFGTVAVLLFLHRKEKWREESIPLLAAMGIFTFALIVVVYGVNAHASPSSQHLLGHVVLWLAVLAVVLVGGLTAKSSASRPKLENSEQRGNTEGEHNRG